MLTPASDNPYGIVAFGDDLRTKTLLKAYQQGIFPWPVESLPLAWFCPEERAILEFQDLHIPRSLAKARKKCSFRFTLDQAFERVIHACAKSKRPEQRGTWITPEMIKAYIEFHRKGHAHSVEVWDGPHLVGGIYGVDADGAFAGESMFYDKPYASKLALLYLIDHLKARGLTWIDIQVMTPHMEALGAKIISRDEFLKKLSRTRSQRLKLF